MSEKARQRIGALAADFMNREDMREAPGEPVAGLIALYTTAGLTYHVATVGHAPTDEEVIRLVRELLEAVSKGEMKEARIIG